MTPQLDGTCVVAPCAAMDTFESDLVLADFLHEMDELDRVQDFEFNHKRQQEPTLDVEPELKKTKTMATASIKSQPRKRRSTSWLRRKQELTALRSESEALETQMAFLQLQQTTRLCQQQQQAAILTEDQEMWKSVAAIAKQECQAAQSENARLRNELETYTRASEMLQSQVVQANYQQQELLDLRSGFVNAIRVGIVMTRHLSFENGEIFNLLEGKMDARMHQLDTIIRDALQPIKEGEQIKICREEGKEAAAAVEFKHARLLPFGQDSTASTIWEIIELGGLVTNQHFVTKQSPDVVGMASRFTVPLDRASSSTVSVDVHAVAKRFRAPTGMVVLVESHSEWSMNHPTAPTWKQTTEEAGYVVVNEHPLQADGVQRACQLRTAMKLKPDAPDSNSSAKTPRTFTGCVGDIVIPSFREILSSHHQSVENFLLDSSRSVRS